ncbi:hypothetical protein LTR70_010460 [Exophiala xenobiotica]|uniref:Zn(2)-C6 fungal-type domain-containing protein n=1 Tax=Lithohypha guttulata TaxID=1690604 RepID=A0ABR0JU02_9EURO|nr:hypothetical protein LTR24_010418 [Lithohypha guttulata]KAK5309239.1 hypothetical protein LTR70_010460 [Exophiala xenobiotica]
MADFSKYTHKWRATTNNAHHSDASKVTKRNRQPVSCQPCRVRKLKCDRSHPCDACTKREEQDSCIYGKATTTPTTSTSSVQKDESRASGMKAQDKLRHLEELVRSMVENTARNFPSPPEEAPPTRTTFDSSIEEGTLNRSATIEASYTGSTHWSAVLQHIHELKNDMISAPVDTGDEPIDHSKPDALFGSPRPPSLDHILKAYLPSRTQVDRRISQYFNARYMIVPFIHSTQFRRQYERFWSDPPNTNAMWVSIMFSICCLAASLSIASSQSPNNTNPDGINQRESFQTAAGQCLVLGNYSKPQPYVVEALALFLQCKYTSSLDPQREVALIFAVQTRLAYLMGYHRDGSNFPNHFTPFEAEMRRRGWAMIKQFDLLVAFQLGIPNNIPSESWDTKFPSNLLDTDFDEDTSVLPPSRPEADITQILYFVVKSRIIDVYTKICHHSISFRPSPPTAAEIMSLDAQIRAVAEAIPESLRIRPISQSIVDPGYEVMVRINLSFLWRKSLCVLHRKYMAASGNDYSYKTCVEAASSMCVSLIDIYPEFQPDGAFENDSWMLSSFTIVDFLLAIIVLCLAMSVSRKRHVNAGGSPQQWLASDETKSVLQILDRCQSICVELGSRSREARRVSGVLFAVLDKLRTTKQRSATGPDGARYFLNMWNGPQSERARPFATSASINDRNGISMKPLSLYDTPTSESQGLFPGCFYGPDKTLAETPVVGAIELSPNKHIPTPASSHSETYDGDNTASRSGTDRFTGNAAAPQDFSMDLDLGLGPFTNFMQAPGDASTIDWTQLDQFMGWYGHETDLPMFDTTSTGFTPAPQVSSNEHSNVDYEDWESTPIYSLGARARDPVTGKSQLP